MEMTVAAITYEVENGPSIHMSDDRDGDSCMIMIKVHTGENVTTSYCETWLEAIKLTHEITGDIL
jgi:hypothetical protein